MYRILKRRPLWIERQAELIDSMSSAEVLDVLNSSPDALPALAEKWREVRARGREGEKRRIIVGVDRADVSV